MRLIKCYVSSFGKLKNFTLDFKEGLNAIKEDNGWGKTTLTFFIKAMFYGLRDNGRSIDVNERKRFMPWNTTERFGGYVEFEWAGNLFKLERYFGKKASEDTVKLVDLKSGREHVQNEDWGRRVFKIDEDGFLSTTFISQKDFEIKNNSSLAQKYSTVTGVDDSIDFEKVITQIDDRAKRYKYLKTDKGLIADTKNELFEIQDDIERINAESRTLTTLKNDLKILEDEREKITKNLDELASLMSKAVYVESARQKKESYNNTLAEKSKCESEKDEICKSLGGHIPTDNELQVFSDYYKEYINCSSKKTSLEKDVAEFEKIKKTQLEKKNEFNPSIILLIIAGILFVAGLPIIFMVNVVFGIILSLVGLCLGATYFILKKRNNVNATEKSDGFINIYNSKCAELEKVSFETRELERKLIAMTTRFGMGGYVDFWLVLDTIKSKLEKYNNILKRLEELNRSLILLESDLAKLNGNDNFKYTVEQIKAMLDDKNAYLNLRINEISELKAKIGRYELSISNLPDYENKKHELEEKLQAYTDEYELLKLTSFMLKKADENLKIKYRAPLENSLNKYLSLMTGSAYNKAKIDIDLNITIEEDGGSVSTDFYSEGYRDMFELCKRFALTDVLFTEEKPFVILDDPFSNLDDVKVKRALTLVENLAKEYQILYFVCHESRRV